jgi:ubiquinone/menaquinone biosynthesis C-methylase UbiE
MADETEAGLAWQIGVWDRMAEIYQREIDRRFAPVIDGLLDRAMLRPGALVLDLGTGTGSVALAAAPRIGPAGRIMAVDISREMLSMARARIAVSSFGNLILKEGRAEAIPAEAASFDAVLASLSLMYVIDRAGAAREIARVLRPGGRFVAAVWAGPENADIVLFQQTAGSLQQRLRSWGWVPVLLRIPNRFSHSSQPRD